ncbi:hypothetical protein GQ457_12G010500 [Hibiscus cannabinus]
MTPRDRLEMNGMIPKVAPQAACAPMEKRIMETMERSRELARPRQMQNMPPSVWRMYRFQRRPRMPNRRAAISDKNPPMGRAKMFAMPKVAAIVPAVRSLRLNLQRPMLIITSYSQIL